MTAMKVRPTRGIGLISSLLILTAVSASLAVVGLLLSQERSRVRDARRMADMVRVQYAFETLYREQASYAEAAGGCSQVEALVATCTLNTYLPTIAALKDPGGFAYRVTKVPDAKDYEVTFQLERGYDGLLAGKHTVSKNGIQ